MEKEDDAWYRESLYRIELERDSRSPTSALRESRHRRRRRRQAARRAWAILAVVVFCILALLFWLWR